MAPAEARLRMKGRTKTPARKTTMKTSRRANTPSFGLKSSLKTNYLLMAIAGSALLAGSLASGHAVGGATTVTTVGILMAIWSRKAAPLRFEEDRFEMKLAPLAGLRSIAYDDILDFGVEKKQVLRVRVRDQKDVKIPLRSFEAADQAAILAALESRAA